MFFPFCMFNEFHHGHFKEPDSVKESGDLIGEDKKHSILDSIAEGVKGLVDGLMTRKIVIKGTRLGAYRSSEDRVLVQPSMFAKIVGNRNLLRALAIVSVVGPVSAGAKYAYDHHIFGGENTADSKRPLSDPPFQPIARKPYPIYISCEPGLQRDACNNACGAGTSCNTLSGKCEVYSPASGNFSGKYELHCVSRLKPEMEVQR